MKSELEPISKKQLSILKRRALLKVIDQLQLAYMEATNRYGLTKKQFADRVGMKPSQLTRILNGRQNVSVQTAEAVLRSLQARTEFGFSFLEDVPLGDTNRVALPKYRKVEQPASSADDRFLKTFEYE
jgi:transcriptional regulator with XRE-family HTH domain